MRAFIALYLSPQLLDECLRIQKTLGRRFDCIRWTKPEQIHLTLKFLGDLDEQGVPEVSRAIESAVSQINPFDIVLGACGRFPEDRPARIVWVGFNKGAAQLSSLERAVSAAVTPLGFAPEKRPFVPHLTIGRVDDGGNIKNLSRVISEIQVSPLRQRLDSIKLMKSELGRGGAVHSELWSAGLQAC